MKTLSSQRSKSKMNTPLKLRASGYPEFTLPSYDVEENKKEKAKGKCNAEAI